MTAEEAEAKSREMFGEYGYIYDRVERLGDGNYKGLPRFYVGNGPHHYGNGDTWEDAFKNVRRIERR